MTLLAVLAVQPATGADPPEELLVPLTGTEPAEGSPAGDLAALAAAARERLDWGTLPVGELADVAILIRTVRPLRLP